MKELKFISPFKKLCITIGNLPTAYIESMSYYEGLTFLVNYLANNVIPAVNNNSEVVKELQDQFVILKNYVDNYFENLDVQEEINNKLDEMADNGELTDIIAQYLGLAGILAYGSVADMKAAENLVEGSKCETYGYYSIGDGGAAKYNVRKILNTDTIDDMSIISLNDPTLIAELIVENSTINSMQAGCKIDDNTFDNGITFNTLFNYANENNYSVKILSGDYYVDTPIVINEKLYAIEISGTCPRSDQNGTRLIFTGNGYCLTLAKGGLKYKISDITILCNDNNSGINCDGSGTSILNFKNYLSNITVTSAVIGMKVVSSTYTFIDNYTFGGSSNTEVGLQIDGFEFTYIDHSSIDGYSETDSDSIGLKINGGINIYISNTDICNFGEGKAIYMTNNTYNLYNLYYNNMNIIRCDGGIVTETGTYGNITSISYDNVLISLSGTHADSHYFYAIKNGTYSIQNIDIRNLSIRNLSNATLPDYVYEQNTGGVYKVSLYIKEALQCPIKKSGIKGGNYDTYQYRNNMIVNEGMKYVNVDGVSTTYTFDIDYAEMTNPPFIDVYVVNRNDYKVGNTSYNTGTGKLSITITFDTAPTSTFRLAYKVSLYGAQI